MIASASAELDHRAARGSILLIAPTLPWPAHAFGGAQRTALLLRALRRLGPVDLLLVSPHGYAVPGDLTPGDLRTQFDVVGHHTLPESRPCGVWRAFGAVGPGPVRRLTRHLAHQAGEFHPHDAVAAAVGRLLRQRGYGLIVSRYLKPAMAAGLGRRLGVPLVLDFDDMDHHVLAECQRAEPWAGWRGRIGAALTLAHLRTIVLRRAARFDHVWVTSEEDRRECGLPRCSVLPNVPFTAGGAGPITPCPPRAQSHEVFFVGHLGYAPNRDGLTRFIERVWPGVRARHPQATLRVAGVGLSDESRRRWSASPGVIVHGFMEQVRDGYEACALTIAPIWWGGGTKIKVLESLAHGRTVVTTPHALHGYAGVLRHGDAVWVADSDEAMAEGCVALLRDEARRGLMASRGSAIVQDRYSSAAFERAVIEACRPLMPAAAPAGGAQRMEAVTW